jgi:hypothetical protein
MTLEEDLRLTLLDRAEKLPAPRPDLLVGVRAGVRRSNYGRAAVGVAAVVAAAIAVAGTENPVRAGQAAGVVFVEESAEPVTAGEGARERASLLAQCSA